MDGKTDENDVNIPKTEVKSFNTMPKLTKMMSEIQKM